MKRVHIAFFVDHRGYLGAQLMLRAGSLVLPAEKFNDVARCARALLYFRRVAVARGLLPRPRPISFSVAIIP